jgi:hypothetical protein
MYEEILQLVKEHLTSDPQVAATVPAEKADDVHQEIASQINTGIQNPAALLGEGGIASLLSGGLGSNSPIVGNLVNNLVSKCGLSPEAGSAITTALPGLLQKVLAHASGGNFSSGGLGGFAKGLGDLF